MVQLLKSLLRPICGKPRMVDGHEPEGNPSRELKVVKQGPVQELPWKPQRAEWQIMTTLAVSSLLVALDATILVPVLPVRALSLSTVGKTKTDVVETLAIDLDGTATDAFWAGTSYLLTHAVLQPFIAALSDIFGRRELLVPSIVFFLVGSIVCAVAHSFTALLAGRVVQGVGGAGIITLAQVIYADIVPLRQRPKYFSLVLGAWAAGSVLGPFIGGCFVQKVTWRWCFYINLPIGGVAVVMAALLVKLSTHRSSLRSKLGRVDWAGGFLFISGLTSLLVAISWGGVQFAWTSWHTLVPLIVGVGGVMISIAWERHFAKEPFLIKSLFSSLSSVAAYTCAFLQGVVLYMGLYYFPFYFIAVRLSHPIEAGVNLFPTTFFLLPGSAVVSQLMTRFGTFRWALWSGWAISVVGAGVLILLGIGTKTAVWATASSIFGVGMGMVLSSTNFAIQAGVPAEIAGAAAAMYTFMRSTGMAVGVAIGGTIFQNRMRARLIELDLPVAIAANAEGFVQQLRQLSPADSVRVGILKAYEHGFRSVFEAMTALCGIGLVVSQAIKQHSLDKGLDSRYSLQR